jgi:hypothetical protein
MTQAPDFDHIVAVKIDAPSFAEAELNRGVMVMLPNCANSTAQRLKAKGIVAAQGHLIGAKHSLRLQVHVGVEYSFEEGESMLPTRFGQTPLEKAARF